MSQELIVIPSLHERRKLEIIEDAKVISEFLSVDMPLILFKKTKSGGKYFGRRKEIPVKHMIIGLKKYKRFIIIHEMLHHYGLPHKRNLVLFGVKGNYLSHGDKDTFSKRLEKVIFRSQA